MVIYRYEIGWIQGNLRKPLYFMGKTMVSSSFPSNHSRDIVRLQTSVVISPSSHREALMWCLETYATGALGHWARGPPENWQRKSSATNVRLVH